MIGQYLWTPVATGANSVTLSFAQATGYDYTICGIIASATANTTDVLTISNILECNLTTYVMQAGLVSLPATFKATSGQCWFYPPNAGYKFQFNGDNASPCDIALAVAASTITIRAAFFRMLRTTQ